MREHATAPSSKQLASSGQRVAASPAEAPVASPPQTPSGHALPPPDALSAQLARAVAHRAEREHVLQPVARRASPPSAAGALERVPADALDVRPAPAVLPRAELQRVPEWMKFWRWGRRPHGGHLVNDAQHQDAPVEDVPVRSNKVPYRNTGIVIFRNEYYGELSGDDRDYVDVVAGHLDDIRAIVGDGFFDGLAANNKQQSIAYFGPDGNQCAGGPPGYTLLRQEHGSNNGAGFGAELGVTLGRLNTDAARLAGALGAQGLPRWSGVTEPAPIAGFDDAEQALAKVNDWLSGVSIPTHAEMDVLMLVVEGGARPGSGTNANIKYDPLSQRTTQGDRPAQIALFHELCHAYYYANGWQLGLEDSSDELKGGRHFELMAVGLPPFDERAYSENMLRSRWDPVVPLRTRYG